MWCTCPPPTVAKASPCERGTQAWKATVYSDTGIRYYSPEKLSTQKTLSCSDRCFSHCDCLRYSVVFGEEATLRNPLDSALHNSPTNKTRHTRFRDEYIMSSPGADSEGETVIPADGESLSSATAFLFAFISLAIYLLFLRPTTNGNNNNATTQNSSQQQQQQQAQPRAANRGPVAIPNRARRAAGGNNNTDINSTPGRPPNSLAGRQAARAQRPLCDAAAEILETCKATPPHFKPSATAAASFSQVKIGGTNVLIDGLVAFSHTRASSLPSPPSSSQPGTAGTATESDGAEDEQQRARLLRQDRAKILSRLFANCSGGTVPASAGGAVPAPPPKGSTLVVGLSWDQTGSDTVSRVLDILATYYTVMVMVEVVPSHASAFGGGIRGGSDGYKGEKSLHEEVVARLRGSSCGAGIGGNATSQSNSSSSGGGPTGRRTLSEAVLPSHRILLASSVTGRVALVRQLASVELVVDYHPDVRNGLERFGYRVSLVSDWASTFASLSSSGSSSDAASSTLTTTRTQ